MEHKISNTTDIKRITTRDQWSSKFLLLEIVSNLVIFVPNKYTVSEDASLVLNILAVFNYNKLRNVLYLKD